VRPAVGRPYGQAVLVVDFQDADWYRFTDRDREVITALAADAERTVRRLLPLAPTVRLLVEPSHSVLEATGDNAQTVAPDLIRWQVDPARDVVTVATDHLVKAFTHEAFHAARFRQLAAEAGGGSWINVAIGEGLATAFARDVAGADEPWSRYDPAAIEGWAEELFVQPFDNTAFVDYRVRHADGREWIAYRVGTWLIDSLTARTGGTAADLVWTSSGVIAQRLLD
jgi:uncharacterized protein YjaZ